MLPADGIRIKVEASGYAESEQLGGQGEDARTASGINTCKARWIFRSLREEFIQGIEAQACGFVIACAKGHAGVEIQGLMFEGHDIALFFP